MAQPPEPMAQLARWLVFIEQFDFDVLHRPGARRGNADGLSRKPMEADEDRLLVRQGICDAAAVEPVDSTDVLDGSVGEPPDLPDELLADLQLLDPVIGPVASSRLKSPVLNSYCQSLRLPRCSTVSGSCWSLLTACYTDAGVATVSLMCCSCWFWLRFDRIICCELIPACVVVTSAFVEHRIKSSAEHFGSYGDAMFAASASSVRTVMAISADSCRELDRCSL